MEGNSSQTFVRILLALFVIYGVYLTHIYNTRIQLIREESVTARRVTDMPTIIHMDIESSPGETVNLGARTTMPTQRKGSQWHDNYSTTETKYILQWTSKSHAPFNFMGSGNSAFVKNNCRFTNCFVTDDAAFINLTDFNAIAFNGKDIGRMQPDHLPSRRAPKQKYIFGAMESSGNYPICHRVFDNYFNWTWTYKLDSDFRWGYITIYDTDGNVVGPAVDMNWPEVMDPISEDLKLKMSSKTKAAAWFVSHCKTKSKREHFVAEVNKELEQFGWKVDIYGPCGSFSCPRSNSQSCYKIVENDYYFYFSLENSFAEDYVTEKLLTALNNFAVPVVFGAANYSRFLPDGSYLDGRKLGPKKLAETMNKVIQNKTMYYDFFRWRNHFSYNETSDNADICRLCDVLNDSELVNSSSDWKDFRKWWNGAGYKDNCS